MAKLTAKQWDNIQKRLLAGETSTAIAKDYPVSRQAIDKRFGCSVAKINNVAKQIVETEQNLNRLPKVAQVAARNLADELMAISNHVASGAKYGAMTFHKLAGIANQHAQALDDMSPNPESLQTIAALTRVGNDAVSPAINLINSNKSTIEQITNEQTGANAPKTLNDFYAANA